MFTRGNYNQAGKTGLDASAYLADRSDECVRRRRNRRNRRHVNLEDSYRTVSLYSVRF